MTATRTKPHHDAAQVRDRRKLMSRIRLLEEKCAELYTYENIRGFLHLYDGEEAIAADIIPLLETPYRLVATYREHGGALARGVSMGCVMAEMYGKAEGCGGGRGGSMHLFSKDHNFYGGNAIVGGGLRLAVGLALADQMRSKTAVTACFFDEGAVADDAFHENLNPASLWDLTVLFMSENKGYAIWTTLNTSEAETDISVKARSYAMRSEVVDGMDVVAVEAAARRASQNIAEIGEPYFLECRTYRFRAYSMVDVQLYRDKEEIRHWREKGPYVRFQDSALESGLLNKADPKDVRTEIVTEIDAAVAYAEFGSDDPDERLLHYVTASERPATSAAFKPSRIIQTTYRDAVKAAIADALNRDDRVFMMGEGVGRGGSCYAVSTGLLDQFGPARVRDTPLSEPSFTEAGIGAAVAGMRPIVELMTVNFSLLALDQIMNTAATLRHMSNNQVGVPVVIHMASGAGKQLAAQHSHSLEGWYAHIPGLRVLAPATIEDAGGMLWTALEDPDPELIFEDIMLYNMKGEIPENAGPVDIDRVLVRRAGEAITLVSYGGSLFNTLAAAEVIDLRSLRPLDMDTIRASVARTHRFLVVDEGWRSGSLFAEIGMWLAEQSIFDLDAPLVRVCSAELQIPYAHHLEKPSLPQTDTIVDAVRQLMKQAHEAVFDAFIGCKYGEWRHG